MKIIHFLLVLFFLQPSSANEKPSDYENYKIQQFVQIPVQQQIEEYEKIYNELLERTPNNPYQTHSDGLWPKIKNAFSLVHTFIENFDIPDHVDKNRQSTCLNFLDTLNQATYKLFKSKELSLLLFERINILCALIGHQYSLIFPEFKMDDAQEEYSENITTLLDWAATCFEGNELQKERKLTLFIKEGMNPSIIGTFDEPLRHAPKSFYPLGIIYMDHNIPLGYGTFTKALISRNYPIFLASFYPNKNPKIHTKKAPHFGIYDELLYFLLHDYQHRDLIIKSILKLKDKSGIDWLDFLKPLHKKIENTDKSKDRIIKAGLFLLAHEYYVILDSLLEEDYKFEKHTDLKIIKKIIKNGKEYIKQTLFLRFSDAYKIEIRDFEKVLTYASSHEVPFLPVISCNEKKTVLPYAKTKQDHYVLIIKPSGHEDIDYYSLDTPGNRDVYSIKVDASKNYKEGDPSHNIDKKGNLILPKEWTWLNTEEREKIENSSQYSKTEYYYLRQNLIAFYLSKGIDQFWNAFAEIAKECY